MQTKKNAAITDKITGNGSKRENTHTWQKQKVRNAANKASQNRSASCHQGESGVDTIIYVFILVLYNIRKDYVIKKHKYNTPFHPFSIFLLDIEEINPEDVVIDSPCWSGALPFNGPMF